MMLRIYVDTTKRGSAFIVLPWIRISHKIRVNFSTIIQSLPPTCSLMMFPPVFNFVTTSILFRSLADVMRVTCSNLAREKGSSQKKEEEEEEKEEER